MFKPNDCQSIDPRVSKLKGVFWAYSIIDIHIQKLFETTSIETDTSTAINMHTVAYKEI